MMIAQNISEIKYNKKKKISFISFFIHHLAVSMKPSKSSTQVLSDRGYAKTMKYICSSYCQFYNNHPTNTNEKYLRVLVSRPREF